MTDQPAEPLPEKVLKWLHSEGFPTEFRTATAFRTAGFFARQGVHYRSSSESPREVDVVATKTLRKDGNFVRCEFVVECKWSASKPWIVFTDNSSRINPAACISQTMGSDAGTALLWMLAGSPEIQAMPMFSAPERPGFGGRQAFSKGDDQFYRAMATVTSAASALASEFDSGRKRGAPPDFALCIFPIVVVEGDLFQSYYDDLKEMMVVEAADCVRCHWNGSSDWQWNATVDIVTLAGLPKYLSSIAESVDNLLMKLLPSLGKVREAFTNKSIADLEISHGARGMIGIHPLLREITDLRKGV